MMDNKQENYINHFVVIGFGTIINIILGFIITPIITRIVDTADYGKFNMFTLYASIATMVLNLGLDQAFVRFFYDKDETDYKKQLLKLCVLLPMIITFFVSIIVIVLSYSTRIFKFETKIMLFLIVYVFANIINRISLLVLRVRYKSKVYSLCNIINRIIYITLALLLFYSTNIDNFVVLIIASLISIVTTDVIAILKSSDIWCFNKIKINIDIKDILKYSFPLILANGLSLLLQGTDKLSLNYFCSYSEIGIYSAAVSLIYVFEIVQTTFNSIWPSLQMEQYTKNKEHKKFFKNVNGYLSVIMFFIGFSLIMFKGLFALFLGEKFRAAANVLPFLVFYPIMYTVTETTKCGIGFSKKTYLTMIVILISCIFNIIGNVFLIPIIGYKGAAVSTGLSYILYFYLNTLVSRKLYYIDYDIWKVSLLIVLLSIFAFYNTFYSSLWISIFLYIISLGVMYMIYKKTIYELINKGYQYIKERKKQNYER